MAISRSEFQVKISTIADTTGAKQAAADLSGAKKEAESLGASLGQATGAEKNFDQAAKESNKTVGSAKEGTKKFKEAIQGLAVEFPALGQVMRLFLNPTSALVGGLAILFSKLWQSVSDYQRLLDPVKWERTNKAIREQGEAMSEMAVHADSYQRNLEDIATAQESIKEKTDAAIEKIRAQNRAVLELEDAEAALKLAQIDAREKDEKISPVEAERQRGELKKEVKRRQAQRESTEAEEIIRLRQRELDQTKATVPGLESEVQKRRSALEENRSAEIARNIRNKESEAALEKERKRMAELVETQKFILGEKGTFGPFQFQKKFGTPESIARDIAEQGKVIASLEGATGAFAGTEAERGIDAQRASDALAKSEENLRAAMRRIAELEKQLPGMREETAAQNQQRQQRLELEERKIDVEYGSQVRQFQRSQKQQPMDTSHIDQEVSSGIDNATRALHSNSRSQLLPALNRLTGLIENSSQLDTETNQALWRSIRALERRIEVLNNAIRKP